MNDPPFDMCIEKHMNKLSVFCRLLLLLFLFFFLIFSCLLFSLRYVCALVTPRRHSMLYIKHITNTWMKEMLLTVTDRSCKQIPFQFLNVRRFMILVGGMLLDDLKCLNYVSRNKIILIINYLNYYIQRMTTTITSTANSNKMKSDIRYSLLVYHIWYMYNV